MTRKRKSPIAGTSANKHRRIVIDVDGSDSCEVINIDEPDSFAVINIDDDQGDDELLAALAQIKEAEESEALARAIQDNWNDAPGPSGSTSQPVINIEDEDDSAMAQRLAQEWALEDLNNGNAVLEHGEPSTDEKVPTDQLVQYKDLFTAERHCTNCGATVKSPRGYVTFSSPGLPKNLHSLLHAPCTSCGTNHCRGCFSPLPCPSSCNGTAHKKKECSVATCCASSRAIAIFLVLSELDHQYISELASSETRVLEALAIHKENAIPTVGPGGTGYAMDGIYGDKRQNALPGKSRGRGRHPTKARKGQRIVPWNDVLVRTLTALTALLPSPYNDFAQDYDMLPHPSIGLLLSVSYLPELLGSLLRNDSVTDWMSETYYAMMDLLRRMADCELTIQTLITRRWDKDKSCGLEEWMFGEGEITWAKEKKTGNIARGPALYEHFEKLTRQSQAFLSGASNMLDDVDDGVMKAMAMCGDIVATGDDMARAMAVLRTDISGKGKGREGSVDMEQEYSRACERLALRYVTLSEEGGKNLLYPDFALSSFLGQTAHLTRNPKDRLHLVKELAVMATGLPPGIWVRIDEVRNDAIKVMIAGPDDTPYAGGLFEFDCFLPIEYPHIPPKMQLKTTGGGSVTFNPNLYSSGQVCLSLLGTWSGRPEEKWSAKSTLLQVFVSIQGMIFNDAPYYNEPGYGKADKLSAASREYNRNISLQTVRWAIVEWMEEKHRHGIWGDVIAMHFKSRGHRIQQQINEWAAKDGQMRAYETRSMPLVAGPATGAPTGRPETSTTDLIKAYDSGLFRVKAWAED